MITLTEAEIKHIASSPDGLEAAMQYHDLQMSQGEAMGFDVSAHQKRHDELKAERDRIREEWEGAISRSQGWGPCSKCGGSYRFETLDACGMDAFKATFIQCVRCGFKVTCEDDPGGSAPDAWVRARKLSAPNQPHKP